MNNTPGDSKLDKYLIDPAFDLTKKVLVKAVEIPIDLVRGGIKALVHGVLGIIIPTSKK